QIDRIRSFTAFILSRTAFTMFVNLLVTEERMPDSTVAKYDLMAFQVVEMRFLELLMCLWVASFIPWKSSVTSALMNCSAFLKLFLIQSQTAPTMVLTVFSALSMADFMLSKLFVTRSVIGLSTAVNTDLMASQMLVKKALIAFQTAMV